MSEQNGAVMQLASPTLSTWKLTGVLLALSTGTSMVMFILTVQFVQAVGLDLSLSVLPFTLLLLTLHYFLLRGIVAGLVKINIALSYLNQNEAVAEIPVTAASLLKPLIEQVNALIQKRTNLKLMRGQLVEQISEAAAQEERNRLARDLHDSIKQQVFSMSISAAAAHAHLDTNPVAAREALLDVKQSAQEAMLEMRTLLQQLSPAPLEKSGLIQALRDQCEALAYRTGAAVETHFGELPPDERLPTGTQETIFRIAQEALSNIARHARAQQVQLQLVMQDAHTLTLRITDDGQGFNPPTASKGMGLANIQTRATAIHATIEISSQPGSGTTLQLTIPLDAPMKQEADMQLKYEAQLQPIIAHYYRFAVAVTAFLVAFSLLTWRLLARPEGITTDPILIIIMLALVMSLIVSLPVAVWSLLRAREQIPPLLVSAGQNSPIHHKMRRHVYLVYLMLSLAGAWFLPILVLGLRLADWVPVAVGGLFLALGVWNYWRMFTVYRVELGLMPITQRRNELTQRLAEARSGWWTTGFLFMTLLLTGVIGSQMHVPPRDVNDWMNTAFLVVSVLFLINQILALVFYRRWRQATLEQGEAL